MQSICAMLPFIPSRYLRFLTLESPGTIQSLPYHESPRGTTSNYPEPTRQQQQASGAYQEITVTIQSSQYPMEFYQQLYNRKTFPAHWAPKVAKEEGRPPVPPGSKPPTPHPSSAPMRPWAPLPDD